MTVPLPRIPRIPPPPPRDPPPAVFYMGRRVRPLPLRKPHWRTRWVDRLGHERTFDHGRSRQHAVQMARDIARYDRVMAVVEPYTPGELT